MQQTRVIAGIDLGRSRHVIHLANPDGSTRREWSIRYTPEEIRSTAEALAVENVIVVAEDAGDPLINYCYRLGLPVYVAPARRINAFRTYITSSGRKDDSTDAWLLTQAYIGQPDTFHEFTERPEVIARLYAQTKGYARHRKDRTRNLLRLRQILHHYFTQSLALTPNLAREWFLRLLIVAPSPEEAQALTVEEIRAIMQNPRGDPEKVRAILAGESLPMLSSTLSMWREQTVDLARQIEASNALISTSKSNMRRTCSELPPADQEILSLIRTVPGVGELSGAIFLSHAYETIHKKSFRSWRAYSGIAPITKASGKSTKVNMRHVCNRMLRDACYHAAGAAIVRSPGFRAVYDDARKRGLSHGCALRVVSNAQGRRMFGVLTTGKPFSEEIAFPT